MKVLHHHIYEYRKGLRNLVLHAICSSDLKIAEGQLIKQDIPYFVQYVTPDKVK